MTSAREEFRVRARAKRVGYGTTKSRQALHSNNEGGFMLLNAARNEVFAGDRYQLTIAEANEYLTDIQAKHHS